VVPRSIPTAFAITNTSIKMDANGIPVAILTAEGGCPTFKKLLTIDE
jgi:hypothetical protein